MGSCCGYVKQDASKTIQSSKDEKQDEEKDIEITLKGLQEDKLNTVEKNANSKEQVAITKKTSVSNFDEIVNVLKNTPNLQIVQRETEQRRVSFLDPISLKEIEIQVASQKDTQKSKEEIINDIKEKKVESITITEKVITNNKQSGLPSDKLSKSAAHQLQQQQSSGSKSQSQSKGQSQQQQQSQQSQQLASSNSHLSKSKNNAAQQKNAPKAIKEKNDSKEESKSKNQDNKKKKAVGFNMEDIAKEMQNAGRGGGSGSGNQSCDDERSDYDTRSIKSERAPKSIIKKKYSDTQSCYGGEDSKGGSGASEIQKSKKRVKWSKEVQNKTKRKKPSFY